MIKHGPILVTGATGFLGQALLNRMRHEGWGEIVALTRRLPSAPGVDGGVTWVLGDLADSASLDSLPAKISVLIHLAAVIPRRDDVETASASLTVNAAGTATLLEACRNLGVGKVVYASTIQVYEPTGRIPYREEDPVRPLTVYGIGKLAGEFFCDRAAREHSMDVTALRFGFIYGPGQPEDFLFGLFTARAAAGQTLQVYGRGSGLRDYLFIDDAVEAIMATLSRPGAGVVNVASGVGVSHAELARLVAEIVGEGGVDVEFLSGMPDDTTQWVMDTTKAAETLNWQASVSLEDGLRILRRAMRPSPPLSSH